MCYSYKEYILKPKEVYRFLKNCQGCGCKSSFSNTGSYRVNANGNRVDVWLIYQCDKCKHTYNLTIHERIRPSELTFEEYNKYLMNDEELAIQQGMDKNILARNKVEIDWDSLSYELIPLRGTEQQSASLIIQNPYNIKIRMDKVLSGLFMISRSRIKELMKQEAIQLVTDLGKRIITVVIKDQII